MANLYSTDPPTLELSLVSFWDVLGYQQMLSGKTLEQQQALLVELKGLLQDAYEAYSRKNAREENFWQAKTFTDNIVMGVPLSRLGHGEYAIGITFPRLQYTQLFMALRGYFIRGGISLGPFYMDDDIVFGSALLEAVYLEKQANFPRVLLSEAVAQHVAGFTDLYADHASNPSTVVLMKDEDGSTFINYLDFGYDYDTEMLSEYWDPSMGRPGAGEYPTIEKHKQAVLRELSKDFGQEEKIKAKYAWLATYHNNFVRIFRLPDDLKIPGYPDQGMTTFLPL